ncbi:MAG: hypothetical protein JSV89_03555 [Spirochaetaceae bacterium]|nr:MAG: hypothetical protein JSV89_03555 [Spirochaetaceae bacterium]
MNPLLLLRVLTRWEILAVSGLCLILIPLVSYLSSLRPRRRMMEFMPPAERALMETPDQRGE